MRKRIQINSSYCMFWDKLDADFDCPVRVAGLWIGMTDTNSAWILEYIRGYNYAD